MPTPPPVRETTTTFLRSGVEIQTAIATRTKNMEVDFERCLTTVSDMLKDKAQGDYDLLATRASSLMLVTLAKDNLKSEALIVKTSIERASYLQKEILDLGIIATNLDSEVRYLVTLDEAKRYGLV